MRVTSRMLESNKPSVLGSVIISPARSSSTDARSASRSVSPLASDGSVTTRKPAIAADAGFVPCAESGISTFLRLASPRSRWYARAMSIPASSPSAPAIGASEQPDMPVISFRYSCSSHSSLIAPCAVASG